MKSAVIVLTFLLAAASPSQQPRQSEQEPPQPASVSGVVEALGGGGIAGATVEMRRIECNNFSGALETLSSKADSDGRFTFTGVHAGKWCIGAVVAGGKYSPAEYLQRGVKGRGATISIAEGQNLTDIRLIMPQTGSISGRVVDANGEPMGRVRVEVLEPFYQNGQRRLYVLNIVQTDDLGEYSLFWLPPGEYYVAAIMERRDREAVTFSIAPPGMGGRRADALPPVIRRHTLDTGELVEETYMPAYNGGGSDPLRAIPVQVAPGADTKVDLTFATALIRSWHIRGQVISSVSGQGVGGAQLRLAPREWSATVLMPYATADKDGRFDIAGVPPGSYDLYATGVVAPVRTNEAGPSPPSRITIPPGMSPADVESFLMLTGDSGGVAVMARIPVETGSTDRDNLNFTLAPAYPLAGRFIVEGEDLNLDATSRRILRIMLTRDPDIVGAPQTSVSSTVLPTSAVATPTVDPMAFRFQGIAPGTYRVYAAPFHSAFQWGTPNVPAPLRNVYIKSIRLGAQDVLADGLNIPGPPDTILEVTLATGGKLSGRVMNEIQRPFANGVVALVPDASQRDRMDLYRSTRSDISGMFEIQGIPPGDYKVFVFEDVIDGAWQSAEFIRNYEDLGKAVRITSGAAAQVEAFVIPAGR